MNISSYSDAPRRPATHHGRIDYTGVQYALCDECELPDDMRRSA